MSATSARMEVRHLVCARCGAAFECGSGGRAGACWCAEESYRLPMPSAGEDCLCPACLRVLAQTNGRSA